MNNTIFFFFYNLAHQSNLLDKLIIFFAVYFPYIVVVLAGLFLLFHHEVLRAENPFRVFLEKKIEFLLVFLSGFFAYFLVAVLKILIHAGRPFLVLPNVQSLFNETGFSFPSGHAALFSALAVSILFLHKKVGYVFMFFALLIGITRIMAGIHFPLDILGGFILGFVVSYILDYFFKKYRYISR